METLKIITFLLLIASLFVHGDPSEVTPEELVFEAVPENNKTDRILLTSLGGVEDQTLSVPDDDEDQGRIIVLLPVDSLVNGSGVLESEERVELLGDLKDVSPTSWPEVPETLERPPVSLQPEPDLLATPEPEPDPQSEESSHVEKILALNPDPEAGEGRDFSESQDQDQIVEPPPTSGIPQEHEGQEDNELGFGLNGTEVSPTTGLDAEGTGTFGHHVHHPHGFNGPYNTFSSNGHGLHSPKIHYGPSPGPIVHLSHGRGHHGPHHKPLKPSVVHRDPHDHFDKYDAIRTQDRDLHLRAPHLHDGHGLGYGHSHGHGHGSFKPYHYDTHKIPECAHKNKHYYNLTFCLEDHYYPTETILRAIQQSPHYSQKLLSDVTYQSADNLVDGLTRAEEEGYTYNHYFGGSHNKDYHLDKYRPPYTGYSYSPEYYKKGGYICPSDIYYARPRRAMNTYGKWKVIVNLDHDPHHPHSVPHHGHGHGDGALGFGHGSLGGHGHGHFRRTYTQTLRLEQCIYSNAPCSYIDSHYYSRCLQKHNFVRLVTWTHEEGLHVDTFKMPIACSCHIQQPVHFYSAPHHNHNHPHIHHHDHPQILVGYSNPHPGKK